jgi:hypothetical protein
MTVAARELVIPATRCVCGHRGCPWGHRAHARVRTGSIDPVWVVVVVGLLVAGAVLPKGLPDGQWNRKGSLAPQTKPGVNRTAPETVSSHRWSATAVQDIPAGYRALYATGARACPALTAQLLAAIGKVESDHGRSSAPGVKRGVNRHGCCAGPMQFNVTNGPPSTWDAYRRPGDSVYDPADAIPAAARKLCANGLADPPGGPDPCPKLSGTAALHRALRRYNNACWYAEAIVRQAARYAADGRGRA